MSPRRDDVLIVGAGSAGCVLAEPRVADPYARTVAELGFERLWQGCLARTRPAPPQEPQTVGLVPGLAPEPSQASQVMEAGTVISTSAPA